jgi:hypothetical protein
VTLRDDLRLTVLRWCETSGRTPDSLVDAILALKGFYVEYGWDNGDDPPTKLGQIVTSDDREYAKKRDLRIARRTKFVGPWEEVPDAE